MPDLRCMCGKSLTDYNICPLPSGRKCNGSTEIVKPNSHKRMTVTLKEAEIVNSVFIAEMIMYGYYDIT